MKIIIECGNICGHELPTVEIIKDTLINYEPKTHTEYRKHINKKMKDFNEEERKIYNRLLRKTRKVIKQSKPILENDE